MRYSENLYFLQCGVENQCANSVSCKKDENELMWHRRFGHLGEGNLKVLARDNLVTGLTYDTSCELDLCEACVGGKIHKKPFSKCDDKTKKVPLELIHSDVCGKLNSKSLGGGEYFLTFTDDSTRYVWVYILKHKDEVFEKFQEWKNLVENQFGCKVKTLRSDNEGEYTSNQFENFLKSEGIIHELSIPRTPEQNGVSERLNRTLMEMVRAMLIDSGLPHKFWAEALSTAVYLKNRSPSRAISEKTPFEALFGKKQSVKHLQIFGSTCYAHIPTEDRKKLDNKSKKCIFLGYGTTVKGYRLYDELTSRVLHSRNVIFKEETSRTRAESVPTSHETMLRSTSPVEISLPDLSSSEEENTEQNMPARRSTRQKKAKDYYGEWTNSACDDNSLPKATKEVLDSPEKELWMKAMRDEMTSIEKNDVWDLVDLPPQKKVIKSRWVYKKKIGSDGNTDRFKARLVAQGCTQRAGEDYDETFCPVVRFESVRTLLALAVNNDLQLHQMDVTSAFLNGELQEEVYMQQPDCFIEKGLENKVCKLKKSIYGLKQAPRCWNASLHETLKRMGFNQLPCDPCMYQKTEGELFIIAVYVDDIILGCKSSKLLNDVKKSLSQQYEMKDLGSLKYFLGVNIIQDSQDNSIWIGQSNFAEGVLQKFGMNNCKPSDNPVDSSQKLIKASHQDEAVDQDTYQSAVGSLLYLSTKTRPDIAYAVGNVAKFTSKPTKQHWIAIKRIFRYLRGTINFGLKFTRDEDGSLSGYSDADWAGDIGDRHSTSGYVFKMGGAAVSWRSKKQACVALSTAEAEYVALAAATQEAVWLRQFNQDILDFPSPCVTLYEDNQSAIAIAKNPQFHGRTKHIDIKFHYVREEVDKGTINLVFCPTDKMVVDVLTKGISNEKFKLFRKMLGMTSQM